MQVKVQAIGISDTNLSDLSVNSPQMRTHTFCVKTLSVTVITEAVTEDERCCSLG